VCVQCGCDYDELVHEPAYMQSMVWCTVCILLLQSKWYVLVHFCFFLRSTMDEGGGGRIAALCAIKHKEKNIRSFHWDVLLAME
jgi:hypothetical protein